MATIDPSELADGIRQRAPGNPLDRVEAALVIAGGLAEAGDRIIEQFVTDARQAGRSWTEIGERMGVSKQAARQRFASHPAAAPAAGPARKPRLAACLDAASRAAAADGSPRIGTQHLLLGLFEEGVAAAILEQVGVRPDDVREAAAEMFPGGGQPAAGPPPESDEARTTICRAESIATEAGHDYVGTEHLLAALILDPGSRARRLLIRLGASIPAIRKELECYVRPRSRRRRRGKAAPQTCSFCGKSRTVSLRLVAGPGVYICAECVALCNEILATDDEPPG